MQRFFLIACCLTAVSSERLALSPVSRVVELLQRLSEKVEEEGKTEESLYNKFVCWGKGLISDKTASNAASESRIDMLNTYVADLDAGRIELTSERVDLEKELEKIHGDMEVSTDIRNKEKANFESAKEELEQGIAALTEAVEVLKTATAGHETGVLLRLRGKVQERARSGVEEAAGLSRAVALGNKILTKADARFLQRLLTGEVPTWDWKKLNRKANFKMGYKARSTKIQDVLSQLLETFTSNLNDADSKEKAAQDSFDKLMAGKQAQKDAAQDSLTKMEEENGAKGMSRVGASEEVALLTQQVADDKKYMQQLQTALDVKKTQWKDRQVLRAGEAQAISQAISILHSDDSRDLFKKSFKSQGYALLQQEAGSAALTGHAASSVLRATGHATHDERLLVLAAKLAAANGAFDDVVAAIVKMLARLREEEKDDLQKKETCEADRMADTREASLTSRSIDEATELMNRLESEISEIVAEIAVTDDKIKQVEAQEHELITVRMDEATAYAIAKKDDVDAAKLVGDAVGVLTEFYKDKLNADLGLITRKKAVQPGAAPPPPPATWDGAYGGKKMESTGIVAVLGMIKDDIEADIAKSDKEEAEAGATFTKTLDALEAEAGRLHKLKTTLLGAQGNKQQKHSDAKVDRANSKGSLDLTMKKIRDAESGCNYFTINYPLRLRNRQLEIDGLLKAQAILKGATFATPADPNRAIKPGDALLQAKRHKH